MSPPRPGGTLLASVPKHHLYLECSCGHRGDVAISTLIERLKPDATFGQAVKAVKCSNCRGVGKVREYRLIFRGASDKALGATRYGEGGEWTKDR